jgi:lysophospholipase L1-like esterase
MSSLKLKLITISISVAFSFFLAEIISRVYFFGLSAFSYSETNSFGILSNSGLITYSDNPNLEYELIPNLDTKYKLKDFKTNTLGFRDKEHSENSKNIKIAVLGDSFTMGTGVSQEGIYVSKTEQLLNVTKSSPNFETYNFGVSGYALTNYLSILETHALPIQPDLLVIGFCASNDHFKIGEDFTYDNFSIMPKKNVFWDSYLKKLLYIKLFMKKSTPVSYSEKQKEYINQEFNTLQKQLNSKHINAIIFYMDLVYDKERVAIVEKMAKQNNLYFVDASVKMKNVNLKKYIVNELDPHPNEKAHLIFAETLSSYILAQKRTIFSKAHE